MIVIISYHEIKKLSKLSKTSGSQYKVKRRKYCWNLRMNKILLFAVIEFFSLELSVKSAKS